MSIKSICKNRKKHIDFSCNMISFCILTLFAFNMYIIFIQYSIYSFFVRPHLTSLSISRRTQRSTTQRTNDAQSQVILFKMKYCQCTNSSNCFISIVMYYFLLTLSSLHCGAKITQNWSFLWSFLNLVIQELIVHYSDLQSLRPHNWLTGEVCRANSAAA